MQEPCSEEGRGWFNMVHRVFRFEFDEKLFSECTFIVKKTQ